VRLLLERGGDVKAKNNYGETALDKVAEAGYKTVVRLLLENRADVNARNRRGQTVYVRQDPLT
jgi:ankyrin repeat protein